ncbi:MAG: hypothetical protein FWF57_04450 [Defluviitaleaceae bacterium]|nr:hypothetical protein [Defluviitaleaceae bacterium]
MIKRYFKNFTLYILSSFVVVNMSINNIYANENILSTDNDFYISSNQTIINFENRNSNLPYTEIAKERLLQSGVSQEFINSMSDSSLELIANADFVISSSSYYREVIVDGVSQLIPEQDSWFRGRSNNIINRPDIDEIARNISIVDENGNVIYSPIQPFLTQNVGGGTIQINTNLFGVQGILSQFAVISEFFWSGMPSFRGTDFFGITRSSNTVVIPHVWDRYFAYETDIVRFIAPGTGGPVRQDYLRTESTLMNNMPNEDPNIVGHAIRINMPNNTLPSQMFPNQILNGRIHWGARGGLMYQGALQTPSQRPQNINHFATYLHQNSTSWLSSPSVSVPLGVSITVSPSGNYALPVTDTILNTWN